MSRVPTDAEYQAWKQDYKNRYARKVMGGVGFTPDLLPSGHPVRGMPYDMPAEESYFVDPAGDIRPAPREQQKLTAPSIIVPPTRWVRFKGHAGKLWSKLRHWWSSKPEFPVPLNDLAPHIIYMDPDVARGCGYDAGRRGQTADKNPCPDSSDAFYSWYKGWLAGSKDLNYYAGRARLAERR